MTGELAKQARALTGAGRAAQALALTTGPAASPAAGADLLMAHAAALKAQGRLAEALPFSRRAVEREPGNRIGWYNYAATLGDLDYGDACVDALHKAMALGLDRPEVHLVMARALTTLKRYDEAEQAFEAVLARDPHHAAGHRDLAQLVWMRTGDAAGALARLEAAMTGGPQDAELPGSPFEERCQAVEGDQERADEAEQPQRPEQDLEGAHRPCAGHQC
ncbi:MAG: tetratricopeptide repeat protein [Pseudomonadota bacterium]